MKTACCRVRPDGRPQRLPVSMKQFTRLLVDDTTGLPNYHAFRGAYSTWQRSGRRFAAFVIDIRGFGRFNERRGGHLRGNELLRTFAKALRRVIRARDLLVRWSIGDEFICLAEVASTAEIDAIGARLEGPHAVQWGRRTRLLSCYAVGVPATGHSLEEVESVLHERLRRVKAAVKAATRS